MSVARLTCDEFLAGVGELADLLVDTVDAGASVGFLAPLRRAEAAAWWRGRGAALSAGLLAVWAVRDEHGIVGTVGLAFAESPNSRHRAEVVKLMVHPRGRGRGIGRSLLDAAERGAAEAGVTLLSLDTETGSPAESLYRSAGWVRAGVIPDYAAAPSGELRPTTLYYRRVAATEVREHAPTR
ncbi:GNAT family N-acetyltransferase [Streptomyces fructofermentans]|uniref:GNAT family N-acetyltransferase n=1 Tax=Streptomyces fructofermentans TaxID=152141 RepID=UPI0037B5A2C8